MEKGSVVVVCERNDYIKEGERQLGDRSVYEKVNFKEKLLYELVDESNSSFKEFKKIGCISDKALKYFIYILRYYATFFSVLFSLIMVHWI